MTRPIRRIRRRGQDIEAIKAAMIGVLEEDKPMTVRQVFYRMVSAGAIPKSEAEYKGTICRLLVQLRREGRVPWGWIADYTRWQRKQATYDSMTDALDYWSRAYRRELWADQEAHIEVWCEKDALAGVLYEVTNKWHVPLMVVRGFSSLSFLHDAGESLNGIGKPAHLYYFGDHDPSGVWISRKIEQEIRAFAPDTEIHFDRVAVKPEQIESMNLPTRPTKRTDSRARTFRGESVELDAIPPDVLRDLCRSCIEQHIDPARLARTLAAEAAERESLKAIMKSMGA